MQVYAAVYDNRNHLLIARKRRSNQFWGGELVLNGRNKVNQAGQFCLPGGRQDAGETPMRGASREFEEETGVSINDLPCTSLRSYENQAYTMVMFEHPDVLQLVGEINNNLQPSHDPQRPAGQTVKCWELEDVLAIGGHLATEFLGKAIPPIGKGHRNSITWYATMAVDLARILD